MKCLNVMTEGTERNFIFITLYHYIQVLAAYTSRCSVQGSTRCEALWAEACPAGAPNQAAYYVALVSILFLLILLCCYFCYFFISKIKELSQQETPSTTPSAAPRPAAYPVQPVIRDSATAMAALCRQMPAPGTRGGTVFPAATSPAALHGDTGAPPPLENTGAPPSVEVTAPPPPPPKIPAAVPAPSPACDVRAS